MLEFNDNPFKMIGKDWFLVTAGDKDQINTMTAGWGGLGVMWGKDVAFIVVRPNRYTREFIDKFDTFSLSFFDESYKKELLYLGSISGRQENKIQKSGLNVLRDDEIPYFKEAKTVMLCKKLYAQEMKEDCFADKELIEKWFPQKDFHIMYVGEILKVIE